jgi:hypothetical protein
MFDSAEIRWFLPSPSQGDIDAALAWFKSQYTADGVGIQPEEREDSYLVFPGCDSVGVKLRAGKDLEIKAIAAFPRPFRLDSGVSGRTDQWVKYSIKQLPSRKLDDLLEARLPGDDLGRWIRVQKNRSLRKFSADSEDLVEVSVNQKAFPTIGCNVELTQLKGRLSRARLAIVSVRSVRSCQRKYAHTF